jgi:hypothetical protein
MDFMHATIYPSAPRSHHVDDAPLSAELLHDLFTRLSMLDTDERLIELQRMWHEEPQKLRQLAGYARQRAFRQ